MALPDDIVIQDLEYLGRRRNPFARFHERGFIFLADDLHAQFDAFIADEHRRARNELANLVLALSAEGAIEGVLGLRSTRLAHSYSFQPATPGKPGVNRNLGSRDLESLFDHDRTIRIKTLRRP